MVLGVFEPYTPLALRPAGGFTLEFNILSGTLPYAGCLLQVMCSKSTDILNLDLLRLLSFEGMEKLVVGER